MDVAHKKQGKQDQHQPCIDWEVEQRKRERPKPIGSSLVSDAENEQLFQLLGNDRISIVAGVAQLLAQDYSSNAWKKVKDGLAVLTKDYAKKHFSLCQYDILNHKIVFEKVLDEDFEVKFYDKCYEFVSFEGGSPYALNFSYYSEARKFKNKLKLIIMRNSYNRDEGVLHLVTFQQLSKEHRKEYIGNPTCFE
uniref:WH1 domain-containing protein n=1 Tax=Meloidogyne hapla TaxID=6305 RepID=A0A1I8BVB4_MELHA